MSFSDLGLLPELLRAVADKGYDVPSPIQVQAIPAVLSGRDVLAGAQTGTGKTAGFVLPILQRLVADVGHGTSRAPRPRRLRFPPAPFRSAIGKWSASYLSPDVTRRSEFRRLNQ